MSRRKPNRIRPLAVLITILVIGAALSGCSSSDPSSGSKGPIAFGEFDPLTGKFPQAGYSLFHGQETAVKEINDNGGILGRKLIRFSKDSTSDAVDAVPAFRALMASSPKPVFIEGPVGSIFGPFLPLIHANGIVAFTALPETQYIKFLDPQIWKIVAPDELVATAMAYYAVSKGYRRCAMLFDNGASSQSFVQPIVDLFQRHGGTIVANMKLAPALTSYNSELLSVFANHPQCVFIQLADAQTTGTLFSDARQLGDTGVQFIGSDLFNNVNYAQAVGQGVNITTSLAAAPSGRIYDHFTAEFAAAGFKDPNEQAAYSYDGVIIAALAMQDAGSSDPSVWEKKIQDVSDPPGTICYGYAMCLSLLKQHKKINYEGASGPMDFDQYHDVVSGFTTSKVNFTNDPATVSTLLQTITPAQIQSFTGGA
jgi:ABC-type branched-subunit amino acid transport system substrate-binding protein